MIKLKDIAVIYTGYSNKIKPGSIKSEWITIKSARKNKSELISNSLKGKTIDQLQLTKNSIVISSVSSAKVNIYGKNHIGALVGKGLYKIELIDKSIPIEFLMSLFKNNALDLLYEGTIIKTLKKQDLENVKINIPSKEEVKTIVHFEQYQDLLQRQLKNVEKYSKGYIRRIHGKDN